MGQTGSVGLTADPGQLRDAASGRAGTARLEGLAGRLRNGVRLTGQECFVDRDLPRTHDGVGADLVAVLEFDDVVPDQFTGGDFHLPSVANGGHFALREDGQLVDGMLRPQFLDDTDERVRQDDEQERTVLPGAHREHEDGEHDEDAVEVREYVAFDDLGNALRVLFTGHVGIAVLFSFSDLCCSQALFEGRVHCRDFPVGVVRPQVLFLTEDDRHVFPVDELPEF